YTKIGTRIVQTQPQAILFVSTSAPRTLDDVDAATAKAMDQINAAIKKLGVHQSGPRITLTTDYGDENYVFDVAVPIDSTSITIDGQAHDLTQIVAKPTNSPGSAPAPASSAGTPAAAPAAGSTGPKGNLIVDANVRAGMLPGGPALEANWQGTPAGIPLMRLALKAYALTHGYTFDDTTHRYYDELVSVPNVAYDEQQFRVFLPLQGDVPQQTPEQASGKVQPLPALNPAVWSGAVPAPASSAAAPAESSAGKAGKKEAAKKPAAKKPARRKHG
ncbi:MAG TPA: polyketide cyclase, partial [Rhodanobacteraceae bacterium]